MLIVFGLWLTFSPSLPGSDLEVHKFESIFPQLSEEMRRSVSGIGALKVFRCYEFAFGSDEERLEVEVWRHEVVSLSSKRILPSLDDHIFVRSRINSKPFKESSFAAEFLIRVWHVESGGAVMLYLDTYDARSTIQFSSMISFDDTGAALLKGYVISSSDEDLRRLQYDFNKRRDSLR